MRGFLLASLAYAPRDSPPRGRAKPASRSASIVPSLGGPGFIAIGLSAPYAECAVTPKLRYSLPFLLLLTLGCSNSDDPRLPALLYEDALQKNQAGQGDAARLMMAEIVKQFPDSEAATKARKDIYQIDALQKKDLAQRQQEVRTILKRVMDALSRYKTKKGEYPGNLLDLVPEYLELPPLTPWGHPFPYRAFVGVPIEDVTDRRGRLSQRINTKLDHYYLCCLGTDFEPGGFGLAADILVKDGEILDPVKEKVFPALP